MADPLEPGLYLIATPIGNRADLSARALDSLRQADVIYCEDTRHFARLAGDLDFSAPRVACHEHSEDKLIRATIERIQNGERVALLSDAGTPAVSDPGFRLVRACRKADLHVAGVPGPNAAIHALSISGLPSDRFLFLGFLPPRRAARIRAFTEWENIEATLIIYESTHRILKCLEDLVATLGPERIVCVARELTKKFETVRTGPAEEVEADLRTGSTKGEFVLLVAKKGFTL